MEVVVVEKVGYGGDGGACDLEKKEGKENWFFCDFCVFVKKWLVCWLFDHGTHYIGDVWIFGPMGVGHVA